MAYEPSDSVTDASSAGPLTGRHIVVGLTGGIACFKTAALVSRLAQQGASVRVAMTEAAQRFIGPLTLQALSGRSVLTSVWDTPAADDRADSPHIGVARWCHLMVIAPASASSLARLTHGLCDDAVSLVAGALPATTPLLLAPAMNADMWLNPAVQRNIAQLRGDGRHIVGPEEGWQACRTIGPGRMSEPEKIFDAVVQLLAGG